MEWTPTWACSSTAPKKSTSTTINGSVRIMEESGSDMTPTLTTLAKLCSPCSLSHLLKDGLTSCIKLLTLQRETKALRLRAVRLKWSSSWFSSSLEATSSWTSLSVFFSSNMNKLKRKIMRVLTLSNSTGLSFKRWLSRRSVPTSCVTNHKLSQGLLSGK